MEIIRNEKPIRDKTIMGNMLDGLRRTIVTLIDYGMNSNRSMSDRGYEEEVVIVPDEYILFSTVDEEAIKVKPKEKIVRRELEPIEANPIPDNKRFFFSDVDLEDRVLSFKVRRGEKEFTITIKDISVRGSTRMLVDEEFEHEVESLDLIGDVIFNRVKELFNL